MELGCRSRVHSCKRTIPWSVMHEYPAESIVFLSKAETLPSPFGIEPFKASLLMVDVFLSYL